MKRDIRINYGLIDTVIYNINLYYRALTEMEESLSQIKSILENSTGKSIKALITNYEDLKEDIQLCKQELDDVRVLLNDYINDMSSYITATYRDQMIRVDRNDVWFNLQSIENSTSMLSQAISFSRGNACGSFTLDEEKIADERYNYNLIEDVDRMAERSLRKINDKIDELWHIYNHQIVPFENTDDSYKSRARDIYYNLTGFGDVIGDFFSWIGEGFCDLLSGLCNGLVDFVKGIFSLVGGVVSYLGSGAVMLVTAPFGTTPSWAENYVEKTHDMVGTILNDPMIIVEGLAQEVSDQIDQEGICYFTGYLGSMLIGAKGLDKLSKATKGLITGQKSANISVVDDVINQAGNKLDDVSRSTGRSIGSKNSIDDIINGVDKGEIKLTNNIQKGNYGEMKMDQYYLQQGYERISLNKVSGLDDVTHQGIDGVYYNPNGHPPYVISEAKYGSSKLSMTNDGKQMSSNWIDNRLDNSVGKEMADKIRMETILNPDNVQSQLIHVTPEGNIIKSVLDEFANKIK